MKFIFRCLETHQVFETDDCRIIEDRGVKTDESGCRVWDAKVSVACPFCRKKHVYEASDLPCPFTRDEGRHS